MSKTPKTGEVRQIVSRVSMKCYWCGERIPARTSFRRLFLAKGRIDGPIVGVSLHSECCEAWHTLPYPENAEVIRGEYRRGDMLPNVRQRQKLDAMNQGERP